MLLDKKVAIVTGAGRGIGQAIACTLAQEGARVVVNDYGVGIDGKLPSAAPSQETVAMIRDAGGDAVGHSGSVADASDVEQLIQLCLERYGRLDILVNNAGIIIRNLVTDTIDEDWDRQIDVHLRGSFLCSKHAAAVMMRQSYGRIVNLTSASGLLGLPGSNAYTAAKAGILGLTKLLAQELAFYNITVNAVAPGANTRMGSPHPPAVDRVRRAYGLTRDAIRGSVVTREPAAVAAGVAYIASQEAHYINGQVIGISGNRIDLWSYPTLLKSEFDDAPWTVESFRGRFRNSIGAEMSNSVPTLPSD